MCDTSCLFRNQAGELVFTSHANRRVRVVTERFSGSEYNDSLDSLTADASLKSGFDRCGFM